MDKAHFLHFFSNQPFQDVGLGPRSPRCNDGPVVAGVFILFWKNVTAKSFDNSVLYPFYYKYRAVVRAWATWAQAHVLKWLIAEKCRKWAISIVFS